MDGVPYLSQPPIEPGETQVISSRNATRWRNPIHLHGHSFHVPRPGATTIHATDIRDTVLLGPEETAEIAFVADDPGRWMLHCHMLEHQASGMIAVVEIA
ncbi:MAG: multicopper oxidase domain-containing protein [Pseudomonadota bacterium]